jgi:UPF0271 protein
VLQENGLTLDINCDLGEHEAPARTRALMRLIDSANVACGGHAGDLSSMDRCVRLAREFGVRLGAHPGAPDRAGFGRLDSRPAPANLALWVVQQAGALATVARPFGMALHHIKLHGALYHASEADDALARAYVEAVGTHFPGVKIYSLSGGRVARTARRAGIEVWEELFADRAYRADGALMPRSEPGAVLESPAEVRGRLRHWLDTGTMRCHDGREIALAGQTLCVHGDGAQAIVLARAVRQVLAGGI